MRQSLRRHLNRRIKEAVKDDPVSPCPACGFAVSIEAPCRKGNRDCIVNPSVVSDGHGDRVCIRCGHAWIAWPQAVTS